MQAIQLRYPDGSPAAAFFCGNCGMLYCGLNSDAADWCCTCSVCHKSLGESNPNQRGIYSHPDCERRKRTAITAQRLERATEVENYSGPVYCESSNKDGYFATLNEFVETFMDASSMPEFVHTCKTVPFQLDIDNILENEADHHHDDIYDNLDGVNDLEKAIEIFNQRNLTTVSWEVDYKHKVRVPSV